MSASITAGQQFGRWTVLKDGSGIQYLCRCSCGKEKSVSKYSLVDGQSTSCGCLNRELVSQRMKGNLYRVTHGHTAGGKSPTWESWSDMIQRCTNPNHQNYWLYGEAGITVCDHWLKFENFLASMHERPEGMTLGRYLDTGNYEPGNCAYMTRAEQRSEAKKKLAIKYVAVACEHEPKSAKGLCKKCYQHQWKKKLLAQAA